ncbi:MAG: DUF1501 domain-containing protein [Planctomycetaceae bacterium]|nr:DUF1501 domain-containing protein [Planctomycetaceae bacterium]
MPRPARRPASPCPGPKTATLTREFGRRELLRAGLTGFATFGLSDILRWRAMAAEVAAQQAVPGEPQSAPKSQEQPTAVILVWLRGGASHLETFDPKPDATSEFRGPYSPIHTNVPGIEICELLPRLAGMADKYALVRSLSHTGGGHPAGSLQMMTGDTDVVDKMESRYPDWACVANRVRSGKPRRIPNFIAVNPIDTYDGWPISGPAYLGPAYQGFKVFGDPSSPTFEVPNIGLKDASAKQRLSERIDVRRSLDRLRRDLDQAGMMEALDRFESQAIDLLVNSEAREAFDLTREPDAVRDRYGRNQWGQQCLMARRLVEAGVEIVTTEFDGVPCGRVQNWDDHAVNQHIFDAMKFRLPTFDQAVSALIEDVYARGLDRRVLVIVTGEFGRTPRISHVASSGGGVASGEAGVVQPGRDHWPRAGSMLFAGGGIRTGQVIGATDRRGEDPIARRVGPEDFLSTIYEHLAIDFRRVAFPDTSGRPIPIIREGEPIHELWRS